MLKFAAMYENFLRNHNLPSGAVLEHIMKREAVSQKSLSEKTEILPQRINDYIKGRRRLTAEVSLKIEKALGISIEGYFYILQTNHDIYVAAEKTKNADIPDLSRIKRVYFWDTDMSKIDWRGNARSVVKRIFEYGDDRAVKEIIRFYGRNTVKLILETITEERFKDRRLEKMTEFL